ncbi:MAG: DUF3052 family protein [Candidatus Eisenbacteria bacterium]|uniref:DUF3052 family protein n=1 Tax=Eiseniibacteriota bacterium TaxID=2212470 RepID=A0A538T4S4_UNCEI|nr:MAG: DUF3052 family protein [Candidatus Eisenbacteria bacterium]
MGLPSARSRVDKLGVKGGQRVSVTGLDDAAFATELADRTDRVHVGRIVKGSGLIVLGVTTRRDLGRLEVALRSLDRDGAVWVVWPKGRRELTEDHIRAAALEAGLVDVKVMAFSTALSALKLVIPVAKR